jgi:hypothetical protein
MVKRDATNTKRMAFFSDCDEMPEEEEASSVIPMFKY